ncbi:MCE family protein [Nocardia puris]|uniref:MCE family protein n=1 Tax=Nocardia puris TaxID=208602 RepID=UPI001E4A0F0A|nr:MCE family protein [Nocardia puris]
MILVAIVATGITFWSTRTSTIRITADFTNSTGLYPGDRVTIRGVPVGAIDETRPMGDRVRITMHLDASHPVGADARAAIVAPTLVSGRYIQLTPGTTSGPKLRDGAMIPIERTAVPVEYDQIKRQVTDLANELGPKAGDNIGALGRMVDSTANALSGNGATLNTTLVNLSKAMQTLADGGPDLFATVRNLQTVVSALAANDQQIQTFMSQLSGTSALLNNNRTQLDAALQALNAMLPELRGFVADNSDALHRDVTALTQVTRLLVDREDDLAQILHVAPNTLVDFYNIYDPRSQSLTGALAVSDFPDPMSMICALLTTVDAPQEECSRTSQTFGDLFGAALRAAMGGSSSPGPAPAGDIPTLPGLPPIPGLPELLTPGAGR